MIKFKIEKRFIFHFIIYNILIFSIASSVFSRNVNLFISIVAIVELYFMVIHFKEKGLIVGIIYNLIGFLVLFKNYGFSEDFYNAFYAQFLASIISISYIYYYVRINREQKNKLKELLILDHLTGIYNSRYFQESIKSEIYNCNRTKNKFGLLIIDIDNFKSVNDNYGHDKGDFILEKFTQEVTDVLRQEDMFFRYGGDEFLILIKNYEENTFLNVTERIINKLKDLNSKKKFEVQENIKVSIGGAVYPDDADNATDLFKKADQALYQAKEDVGFQVKLYNNIS